jgi:hypothetical protein
VGALKIPSWTWITVIVIACVAILVRNASQESYFRGIADDAHERLEEQEVVLDSVRIHAEELSEELAEANSAAAAERLQNERVVATLTRTREEARERSEAFSERLRATLDSVQTVNLDSMVRNYDIQISSLEHIIETERAQTNAERLRATQANLLVLGLRDVITEHEATSGIMRIEIEALRSANRPSFGVRLQNGWWMAVAGFAIGIVVGL